MMQPNILLHSLLTIFRVLLVALIACCSSSWALTTCDGLQVVLRRKHIQSRHLLVRIEGVSFHHSRRERCILLVSTRACSGGSSSSAPLSRCLARPTVYDNLGTRNASSRMSFEGHANESSSISPGKASVSMTQVT